MGRRRLGNGRDRESVCHFFRSDRPTGPGFEVIILILILRVKEIKVFSSWRFRENWSVLNGEQNLLPLHLLWS